MKPTDLYIGVSAFFSIVVPGFLVTIAVIFLYGEYRPSTETSSMVWTVLAVASYVIGHVLFAIGSYWDYLYDKHKPSGNEPLLKKIDKIRSKIDTKKGVEGINHYKWCRSALSILHTEGLNEVMRKEADSKLFRSLIIPLIIFIFYWIINSHYIAASLSLLSAITSYLRYRGQRFKACEVAYTHVIVLTGLKKL